jgi:glycosyltransferase involved in cell wall biosynthesis
LGKTGNLDTSVELASEQLTRWANHSDADYLLLWSCSQCLPEESALQKIIEEGIDLAHCGLKQGIGELWPSLSLLLLDWGLINGPKNQASSSWRVGLGACLIRRDLIIQLGSLDTAFLSKRGAGLEFGYRCLEKGALVEYRPELVPVELPINSTELALQDLYVFLLRHFKRHWSKYIAIRRSLSGIRGFSEVRAFRKARARCLLIPAPKGIGQKVWYSNSAPNLPTLFKMPVSVIIPTLGRYPYLADALKSMRRQTIKPYEVIVIDQNPLELRQPDVYKAFGDLNLKIIWQDRQGQSYARNAGLEAASGEYIFLFEDDAIAYDDVIESHLEAVSNNRFDVSSGVALPPQSQNQPPPVIGASFRIARTFATGNSLLALAAAQQVGGFDGNFDFGPGADLDFGTRLYLAGLRIALNPKAVIIHFKAPMGGLRLHGAHKYNTDAGLLHPFPPITQSYYGLRYLSKQQQRERLLIQFATSKFPKGFRPEEFGKVLNLARAVRVGFGLLLLPFKWNRSLKGARALVNKGSRLGVFKSAQPKN